MYNIIIDTGFWFALFDSRDQYHNDAVNLLEYLELGNILIPFPSLYESINTRFTKRKVWMTEFESILGRPNITLIEDVDIKDSALDLTFTSTIEQKRPISLVDTIIRILLDDPELKIDYLMTFNAGDFFDICQRRQIEIISG